MLGFLADLSIRVLLSTSPLSADRLCASLLLPGVIFILTTNERQTKGLTKKDQFSTVRTVERFVNFKLSSVVYKQFKTDKCFSRYDPF